MLFQLFVILRATQLRSFVYHSILTAHSFWRALSTTPVPFGMSSPEGNLVLGILNSRGFLLNFHHSKSEVFWKAGHTLLIYDAANINIRMRESEVTTTFDFCFLICRRLHTLIIHRAEISNAMFNFDCSLIVSGSMVSVFIFRIICNWTSPLLFIGIIPCY